LAPLLLFASLIQNFFERRPMGVVFLFEIYYSALDADAFLPEQRKARRGSINMKQLPGLPASEYAPASMHLSSTIGTKIGKPCQPYIAIYLSIRDIYSGHKTV